MARVCPHCKEEKSLDEFAKKAAWCKSCMNEYAKQYREKNKEMIKEKNKKWYDERGKEWKKEYDSSRLEYVRERDKKKYEEDVSFRLRKVLRTRLNKTLKTSKKSYTMMEYLGCPLDYFKKFIEKQFSQDMAWENHGTIWDIDHVKPCSSYNLEIEEERKVCYSWKNMRPLSKLENNQKSNRIIPDVIEAHKQFVESYLVSNPVPS